MISVYYYCNHCKFKAVLRKHIRKHMKEIHKFKGAKGPPTMGVEREPLSAHYERR